MIEAAVFNRHAQDSSEKAWRMESAATGARHLALGTWHLAALRFEASFRQLPPMVTTLQAAT